MKKLLFFLIVLSIGLPPAQAQLVESHDFITYDTIIHVVPDPTNTFYYTDWNVRITRPRNMFTAGNADTASRPAIISMPGQGEQNSTDTSKLHVWGPHYWLQHGWDGSVVLANGTHYPILITIACRTTLYPAPEMNGTLLAILLNIYHIKRAGTHVAGLSQGAFSWSGMIAWEKTRGDETGMKLVTSITLLEGFAIVQNNPYSTWARGDTCWAIFATKYKGKMFGLEGINDYRNVAEPERSMQNLAIGGTKGSAYFSYEKIDCGDGSGVGGHGCWNVMYNPANQNWQNFAPMGPYNTAGSDTNSRGTYQIGSSIFQWMLRQGDSSMVVPQTANTNLVKSVIVAEYKTWYTKGDSTTYSYNNSSAYPIQYPIGGKKIIMGAGGFNYVRVLDTDGYMWSSAYTQPPTNTMTRMDTDTTGFAFSGNWWVDAYAHVYLTIRADSSLWYGGIDEYSLFYPGGSLPNFSGVTMKPTQLSPAGMKFKKALFGGDKIIALTTAGDVYIWVNNGSRTPTKMTIPRPAIDIFISHLSVAGCIIPDVTGSQTMGYPYVWGNTTSMYGGGAPFSQPTSIKALWGITVPIKEIAVSWNTIHFIDSLKRLWGCGFNSMGEVGNGQEFVNKFTYPGFPGYGWTFTDYENPSGIPVQIGTAGIKWKHLFSNNWFAFYTYATDENDSVYSWGRNKALVLGNGFSNNQESTTYDAMDVLSPTMVSPLTARYQQYNFKAPSLTMGPDKSITTSAVQLVSTGNAVALAYSGTLNNGIDSVGYHFVSSVLNKLSGPTYTATQVDVLKWNLTNLVAGTYMFQMIATDNNTGTIADTIQVTVSAFSPPVVSAGSDQTIRLPTTTATLVGSAAAQGGATLTSTKWTQDSGPNAAVISTPNSTTTTLIGLIIGTYVFRLTATDSNGNSSFDTVKITVSPQSCDCLVFPLPTQIKSN